MGGNALVWVTFIVIQLVHVYIYLIDYCWHTVLWDHIRDATWYLIWSNTGHLTFMYGYTVLAGKTKESFGELLRKRSGKEVVIYSDHLREHFMPEVFLLSPSTIWATKEKQHLQSSMAKRVSSTPTVVYTCRFFYYNLYAPKHEAKSISLAY